MNSPDNAPVIFGACVAGPGHVKNNIPCQDALAFEIIAPGFGVIAVADGLGSASKSQIGSETAVQAALEWVRLHAQNGDLGTLAGDAVKHARRALEEKAVQEQTPLWDLATTLIVALFHEDTVCVAQIGDGGVVGKTPEGLTIISPPGESEYVNEVVPLTSLEYERHLRVAPLCPEIECLAVFTDGCQRAALQRTLDGLLPHEKFFEPLFAFARETGDTGQATQELRDFLCSRKMSEHSEDDKTLVLAVLGT